MALEKSQIDEIMNTVSNSDLDSDVKKAIHYLIKEKAEGENASGNIAKAMKRLNVAHEKAEAWDNF